MIHFKDLTFDPDENLYARPDSLAWHPAACTTPGCERRRFIGSGPAGQETTCTQDNCTERRKEA